MGLNEDIKQLAIFGTVLMGIVIGGYIVHVEKRASNADKDFVNWVRTNKLDDCMEHFFMEKVGYLDGVTHFNVHTSAAFKKVRVEKRNEAAEAISKLRKQKALQMWLITNGLSDSYLERLQVVGVTSLKKLQQLSEDQLELVTPENTDSLGDYHKFKVTTSKLRGYGANLTGLEEKMLIHHKHMFDYKPNSYSLLTFVGLVFTTLAVTLLAMLAMFVSQMQGFQLSRMNILKVQFPNGLYYLTGHYDITQHTKVIWNWVEPQTVGKTMNFTIKFFHKNGKPYPISDTDNITVEISVGGTEVAKTMVLGGVNPDEANIAKVSYTVQKSGDYIIAIMLNSKHIKGSPFTKKFEAGPIDAAKTGFMNYTSTVVCTPDTSYPLTIEARDSFGNVAAYKADQNNYFKIKVTECGSQQKHVPATQIFYNPRQKQLTMHIKMEKVGCFQASVTYGEIGLKNGDFNILVLSSDDLCCVDKNITKSRNIWYEARLIECNHEKLQKPKKVFIYLTPKQLKLKEYFLKIIGKKLFTYRVCPSTKFAFSGFHNQLSCPMFTIDDGAQPPIVLGAKDRSIIAATFTKFLLRNIGGSETFNDKQVFFYHEIRTLHQKRSNNSISVKVDRSRLLHTSYKACKGYDVSDWCKMFEVTFIGEQGLDWGGVRREWFELVCTHLFDPVLSGLFKRLSDDSQGLVHPNAQKRENDDFKMFEFAGKIVGKCLYESSRVSSLRQTRTSYRQLVKARFSRSFLAQLIGLRVHYKYFETDDPELYKSKIKYIEENDIDEMELTFSEEELDSQGNVKTIDLLPGGSKMCVTEENKLQYLDLLAQHRLANTVREQIDSFLKGLNELIPDNLLSIFDENELELLLCGVRNYSVADLKSNVIITERSTTFCRVLDWFWTIIGNFNDEQMARLLQFTTGCSQLPPGGFAELVPKFQISSAYTYNTLPTAHTCFNTLCLPDYDSIDQMYKSLLIALNEGNTGFGLV